ncbi:MAG: hypothetical protein E6I35_08735 [Chloroflexi bacterium]|nr:MAG: hypothetical protein E6I35_08735 [Chloroflexota bacterium]
MAAAGSFSRGKMRRLVLALGLTLGLTAATPSGVAADISLTQTNQVILSCNDGHSLVVLVDSATLTSLGADVASINSSGTGMSCTLDTATADPSMRTSDWTVFDYNPSGQALAPRHSPNSMPATTTDNGVSWQFQFKPNIYTALFTTTDPSVTGNDSTKTLTDTITVSGNADSFMTQHNGGAGCASNVPATVRFYFTSPSASDPAEWSDWNGKSGANPAVTEAFIEATQRVQSIGLSFGGVCFFETGVTPTPSDFSSEQFSSQFSAS